MRESLTPKRARRWIREVGAFDRIDLQVESASFDGSAVRLRVTLGYRAALPICCGMPECYMRFLRTEGLEELADEVAAAHGLLVRPRVEVVVRQVFEPGFRFHEYRLWRPEHCTEELTYVLAGHA